MPCDICGSEEKLYHVVIEGTELQVCKSCSRFGKILKPVKEERKEEKKAEKIEEVHEKEVVEMIVSDFSSKIRKKREQLGLKQEEFAKKINEKESVIHKLETGEITPSLKLAKKLEKFLKIKLIEEYEEGSAIKIPKEKPEEMTIGDLIKIKK